LFALTFSQNLRRIEEALQRRGVICFVKPKPENSMNNSPKVRHMISQNLRAGVGGYGSGRSGTGNH
jgi:hypothetical protein